MDIGDWNIGEWTRNTGDWNTGDWNRNTGDLNTPPLNGRLPDFPKCSTRVGGREPEEGPRVPGTDRDGDGELEPAGTETGWGEPGLGGTEGDRGTERGQREQEPAAEHRGLKPNRTGHGGPGLDGKATEHRDWNRRWNTGDWNIRDWNRNTGDWNIGDWTRNTGDWNIADWTRNTGDWNIGDWNR
ncbi:hypothetical protein EYF80_055432 [Liparis tanakae]|uniref:Uncharacterized protein n=1 Tax=Liparis tanakae TaxID=230148 RepID=A0A4Z2EZW6_9TELE|nr:hypothetical protein EYF80_055432 [Liparis tanakae]